MANWQGNWSDLKARNFAKSCEYEYFQMMLLLNQTKDKNLIVFRIL